MAKKQLKKSTLSPKAIKTLKSIRPTPAGGLKNMGTSLGKKAFGSAKKISKKIKVTNQKKKMVVKNPLKATQVARRGATKRRPMRIKRGT